MLAAWPPTPSACDPVSKRAGAFSWHRTTLPFVLADERFHTSALAGVAFEATLNLVDPGRSADICLDVLPSAVAWDEALFAPNEPMTRIRSLLLRAGSVWAILERTALRWLVALVGRWEWQAPAWLPWVGRQSVRGWRRTTATRARAATLAAVVITVAGAGVWWFTRPTPHYVSYSVTPPGLTEYDDNGISSIKPLRIVFSESVAPLAQMQKAVTKGLTMSPSVAGEWFWTTDKELQFTPKDDWPVDGAFSVQFARNGFFADGVVLESYRFPVRSEPFSVTIAESQFYQDPRDPNLKKLVATLKFTHPVDTEQLESRVSLAVARDAEYLGLTPDSRHFTVAYDKFKLAAYVHSAALAMPRDDTPMTLKIDRGVRAARGGNDTPNPLQSVVTIPGRTSLRFSSAGMTIVDNARYEPEQILLLASSSPVVERALAGAVSVRLLPVRSPRQAPEDKRPYRWQDEAEIGADILGKSDPLTISYVPSDEGGNTSHGFKFRAPVGRYLHVTVKDGVQGTGGYISGKPYVTTLRVDRYKRALTFLGTGALLPLTGDRKVGFLSRDVETVDVEIARVLPNQLQHLAPQMWDFSRPALYDNLEDTLVERFTATRDYRGKQPGKPTYDTIDLGQYLDETTRGQRGLFVVHLRAKGTLRQSSDDFDEEGDTDDGEALEDMRLILVTDLGFIVKEAKDGSRDVFAQSIRTGLPVEGARIDMVGSNGLTMLSATTDLNGRAQLPRPSPEEAKREKTPLLDPRAKRRGHVVHAAPIERARAGALALRYRRRGERALGAAAVNLPVFGPRHLSTGRDDASGRYHADRRLESVACRPSTHRRHH